MRKNSDFDRVGLVISCKIKFARASAVRFAYLSKLIADCMLSEFLTAPLYTEYLAIELKNLFKNSAAFLWLSVYICEFGLIAELGARLNHSCFLLLYCELYYRLAVVYHCQKYYFFLR